MPRRTVEGKVVPARQEERERRRERARRKVSFHEECQISARSQCIYALALFHESPAHKERTHSRLLETKTIPSHCNCKRAAMRKTFSCRGKLFGAETISSPAAQRLSLLEIYLPWVVTERCKLDIPQTTWVDGREAAEARQKSTDQIRRQRCRARYWHNHLPLST